MFLSFFFITRLVKMGNALTTASASATNAIAPISQVAKPSNIKESQSNPLLECPMHKPKNQLNTIDYTSKCPIDQMDGSDISPLNMV